MIKRFLKSAGYAVDGFLLGVREERNVRIDLVAMIVVLRLALFYDFDRTQWAVVILLVFLIPSLELLNTAVERAVHKPDTAHYMPAGQAKDAAAGGVFLMALGAVIVGFVMFWDTAVFSRILAYYMSRPLNAAAVALFAVGAYLFIIKDNFEKKRK